MARLYPTSPQFKYINASAQFPAFVAGFGAGKTEAAIQRCIIGKLRNPSTTRGFYEPTYDLIRMIAFPRFEEILTELKIPYRLHKSPLNYIDLGRFGKIVFRSMENVSRIIGYEHSDADIDELDTLKSADAAHVFRAILARNRQVKPNKEVNSIGVTTTPEGFKFVYETWKKNPKPGYVIIQAPTSSNPHLPSDYVDNLKNIYPSEQLRAYTQGEFVNLVHGTVFNCFNREANVSHETIEPGDHLYIGMDFNVTNMSAVVYVKRGEVLHAVEELTKIYDTPTMIDHLIQRYNGHRVTVYPDASGGARKTVNASVSDISLLESAGVTVLAPKANPPIKDRVMAANSAFDRKYVMISQNCSELISSLEQLSYDNNGLPDKTSGLDHITDAATYIIHYEMPVRKPITAVPFRFNL